MTAAKSQLGHSEPVAGLIGMVNLGQMLAHSKTSAIMHLSQVRLVLLITS